MDDLVSFSNPHVRITNSDLELVALVLHEAVFPSLLAHPIWRAQATGSYNTSTVSWTFKEAATINSVIADLLRIRSSTNRQASIISSVFYHPGHLNTMADDA